MPTDFPVSEIIAAQAGVAFSAVKSTVALTLPGSTSAGVVNLIFSCLPYSQTLVAANGTGPYTFAVTSGSLPPGFTLNPSSGLITGSPSSGSVFIAGITATDSLGNTVTISIQFNITTRLTTLVKDIVVAGALSPSFTYWPAGLNYGTPQTPLSNEYRFGGIQFLTAIPGVGGSLGSGANTLPDGGKPPGTVGFASWFDPNVVWIWTGIDPSPPPGFGLPAPPIVDLFGDVCVQIVIPGTATPATVGLVSVEAGFAAAGKLLLSVYDVNSNLIATRVNGLDGSGPHGRSIITISAAGIAYFKVSNPRITPDAFGVCQITLGCSAPIATKRRTFASQPLHGQPRPGTGQSRTSHF